MSSGKLHSIRDRSACDRAVELLRGGRPVGTYIRGVCGLWADGRSESGLDTIYRIKGAGRGDRPISEIVCLT